MTDDEEYRLKDEADQKLTDDLRQHGGPYPGQTFEHYKGGRYVVVATGILEATTEPAVHYFSLLKGKLRTRTLANWRQLVEHTGQTLPRFRLLPDRPYVDKEFTMNFVRGLHLAIRQYPTSIISRSHALDFVAWLHELHQDNANDHAMIHSFGILLGLHLAGLINKEDVDFYRQRLLACPEQGVHQGGRSWCAYCGDVKDKE